MNKYKLMIKTCVATNKKYLCTTQKENYIDYKGSGKYWLNHLKKYGRAITTELIYSSDDLMEFSTTCIYYSNILDIVNNNDYANLIIEDGINTYNFSHWWKTASKELKEEIVQKRSYKIKENHWINSKYAYRIREEVSSRCKSFFSKMTHDEKLLYTEKLRRGYTDWFKNLTNEELSKYKDRLKKGQRHYYNNVDPKIISEKNRKSRINTPNHIKQIRKKKIQEVYATGKHQGYFDKMSSERKGINNPACKIIVWDGIKYPKGALYKQLKKYLTNREIDEILDEPSIKNCYRDYIEKNNINRRKK